MFKLGRRKSQFTERYEKIGAGQPVGQMPEDDDAAPIDPDVLADAEAVYRDIEGLDTDLAGLAPDKEPRAGETADSAPDSDLPAVQAASDKSEQAPALPRVHANGHDHPDALAEQDTPAWLDSFDPQKPMRKPMPPVTPEPAAVADEDDTEAITSAPDADPATRHEANPAERRPQPRLKPKPKLITAQEPKQPPPAPAWLDTAEEVE